MVSSSYQWLCDGHEAIAIALQWSFKAYIDQFEAIAMLLTIITRPIIEMPKGGINYCFWVAQTLWLKPHGPGPLIQNNMTKVGLTMNRWTDKYPLHSTGHCPFGAAALLTIYKTF